MSKLLDKMTKALDIAESLQPSTYGLSMQMKRHQAPPAQSLSDIDDGWQIPQTYHRHYEWLKENDPIKAQAFWDKWKYDPSVKPVVEDTKALNALNRVGQPNTLKRRI